MAGRKLSTTWPSSITQARIVARDRVTDDAAGFGQLLELLAEYDDGEPARIEIAIETDKGLFVAALVAAGFTLFSINPRAAARYRERHGQAGGKSDRGDAVMLANNLRTDRHVHRPLPADTELARAVKATARQHPGSDLGTPAGHEPAALPAPRLLSPGAGGLLRTWRTARPRACCGPHPRHTPLRG